MGTPFATPTWRPLGQFQWGAAMANMRGTSRNGLVVLALAVGACGGSDSSEVDTQPNADSGSAMSAQSPSGDVRFLRQMSDHHAGLVLIAEQAHTRAQDDSVRSVAENLHMKQVAERDSMVAMLSEMFSEQHTAQPMQKNRAQADSVSQMSGTEHDRYFLRTVIAHHQEGIRMIDQQLPGLTMDHVRMMAEKMKGDQQREIQELEGKLGNL